MSLVGLSNESFISMTCMFLRYSFSTTPICYFHVILPCVHPCITTMSYFHVLLPCVTSKCYFHVLLPCVTSICYFHVLLTCVTSKYYFHVLLLSITSMCYFHMLPPCVTSMCYLHVLLPSITPMCVSSPPFLPLVARHLSEGLLELLRDGLELLLLVHQLVVQPVHLGQSSQK